MNSTPSFLGILRKIMSQLPSQYVKRGTWVNVEDGPILGRVITTDSRTGTLVIAILAIAMGFGTTHLWNIITFSYHQARFNSRPFDGLFRQQQALLRTRPTAGALVSDWLKLWWIWRDRAENSFLRSLPHLLLGILFTTATIAISLSTSYIVSTTDVQVLVESPLCGPSLDLEERPTGRSAATEYSRGVQAAALSYAEDCYFNLTQSTASNRCTSFIRPNIRFRKERVACPFTNNICAKIENPALSFDSGLVDLNSGFGFNLQAKDGVKYRRKTTCAVIDVKGRYSIVNDTNKETCGQDNRWRLHLGKIKGAPYNWTMEISAAQRNVPAFMIQALMKYGATENSNFSTLEPIPEMSTDNADITLIFLYTNAVTYPQPVDDPFFPAHWPVVRKFVTWKNITTYKSDHPFAAIGCKVQYQFCYARSSGEDHCTELGPLPSPKVGQDHPGASDLQLSALQLLKQTGSAIDIEVVSSNLKAASLVSSTGISPSLPGNQWEQEIERWESGVWAASQMMIADFSIGMAARIPTAAAFQNKSSTAGDKRLCKMQRMRNPGGFVNINVFGLAFTLTICGVTIVVDIVLLRFLIFLKKFRKALAPRIDAWIQDGVYQLQRRAYEAHGEGTWERLEEEIPLTKEKEELAKLPVDSLPTNVVVKPEGQLSSPASTTANPPTGVLQQPGDTATSLSDHYDDMEEGSGPDAASSAQSAAESTTTTPDPNTVSIDHAAEETSISASESDTASIAQSALGSSITRPNQNTASITQIVEGTTTSAPEYDTGFVAQSAEWPIATARDHTNASIAPSVENSATREPEENIVYVTHAADESMTTYPDQNTASITQAREETTMPALEHDTASITQSIEESTIAHPEQDDKSIAQAVKEPTIPGPEQNTAFITRPAVGTQ